MEKLHNKLKWETIINRVNSEFDNEIYYLEDSSGKIYKLDADGSAYIFYMNSCIKTTLSAQQKQKFIENL